MTTPCGCGGGSSTQAVTPEQLAAEVERQRQDDRLKPERLSWQTAQSARNAIKNATS